MRGLDTNVLVFAHVPSLPQHARVRPWLQRALREDGATFAVTPTVLQDLVHVITDSRRFEPPVSVPEALATARLYLNRSNVRCLACDEEAASLAVELMERHRLGRKRLADALLAATFLRHGIVELVTCNPRDFTVFDDLQVVDPTDDAQVGSPSE